MIAIIDSGTTHTRILLTRDGEIVGRGYAQVGARDTALTGTTDRLRDGLCAALRDALRDLEVEIGQVSGATASGMITSNLGLADVPHVTAPAGAADLAARARWIECPEILRVPILFIPGVKNRVDEMTVENLGRVDFMRGEEVQALGIVEEPRPSLPATILILSSHTKAIGMDEEGRILGSVTTLSGQLFSAIRSGTSMADSLPREDEVPRKRALDKRMVRAGYEQARRGGFLRPLLMVRFLDVLMSTTPMERMGFLEGAIASEDLLALRTARELGLDFEEKILVGSPDRCAVYRYLMEQEGIGGHISILDEAAAERATVAGSLRVMRERSLIVDHSSARNSQKPGEDCFDRPDCWRVRR